ncbi:hypothetical protein AAHC03_04922 [Spirometra sp. Aus1]
MPEVFNIVKRQTTAFEGQKPGTSGLRKPVSTFRQPNYTENFVQAILTVAKKDIKPGEPFVLIVGGDGRYFLRECLLDVIIPLCAANGVTELIIGENGIISTPAVSCMIRKRKTNGGIILTASHNPGGPHGDFGIKYNIDNGGPAPEHLTDAIYEITKTMSEYITISQKMNVDLSKMGTVEFQIEDNRTFKVSIVSSVDDYVEMVDGIFDFQLIKNFLSGANGKPPFKIVVDALHGVTGPYLKRIICEIFGMPECATRNCNPLEDFGGHHPDPNLTYAADLVDVARKDPSVGLAAAFDGDGDRNMIIGQGAFFVTPCDSLAVIADNAQSIKYFQEKGVRGFARSMPTSPAVDRVCKAKNLPVFETPTGWKFFGNLLDADMASVCGEESFGTGSNHIREKDGIWALLSWLSILADRQRQGKSYQVPEVVHEHWATYGRDFFTRYDYENMSSEEGKEIMRRLQTYLEDKDFAGRVFQTEHGMRFQVLKIENFSYSDPVDKSVSGNQGIMIFLDHDTRLVFRLSGTGSSGATLRMYVNTFSDAPSTLNMPASVFMAPHIELGISLCGVEYVTGRIQPTVIT